MLLDTHSEITFFHCPVYSFTYCNFTLTLLQGRLEYPWPVNGLNLRQIQQLTEKQLRKLSSIK